MPSFYSSEEGFLKWKNPKDVLIAVFTVLRDTGFLGG